MKNLDDAEMSLLRDGMIAGIDDHYRASAPLCGRQSLPPTLRAAMRRIPRHRFVPEDLAAKAYDDAPLPVSFGKSVSQPFMSALMIDLLDVRPGDHVLEVGTGLGYQTALIASFAARVWSVEIVEELVLFAASRMEELEIGNVTLRVGDGTRGWPGAGPFEAILVSAAAREIPPALLAQMTLGGRMVMPLIGEDGHQRLVRIVRVDEALASVAEVLGVNFTELETSF